VTLDRICRQSQPGDSSSAAAAMVELGRIIDQLAFPVNVAAGMEARGLKPGVPKTIVSPESRVIYNKIVRELTALFAKCGLAPAAAA
jgi:hypothetical protein